MGWGEKKEEEKASTMAADIVVVVVRTTATTSPASDDDGPLLLLRIICYFIVALLATDTCPHPLSVGDDDKLLLQAGVKQTRQPSNHYAWHVHTIVKGTYHSRGRCVFAGWRMAGECKRKCPR